MQNSETISTEKIRSYFPALKRNHNGFPVAYFDGPGGTQVPVQVVEAMTDYLFNHNANTHWNYPTSRETDEILLHSRQAFADFFNASADEIVFGQNMTSLIFHLSRAISRDLREGDEIILTELDHHANIDTWRELEKERGVTIRVAPMDIESGTLIFDELEKLFNEKTKILAIGAASNALGTITDIKRACRLAKDVGALSFVDAVHFASHQIIDVKDFDCDFLACSAYKFYGPHIGILYGRKELLEKTNFPKLRPATNLAPERAETGTQSHESIAGAGAAVGFLASLSTGDTRREKLQNTFSAIHTRHQELVEILWQGLGSIEKVKLYGPNPKMPRTSTVSFTVENIASKTVAEKLTEKGIFVSNGNFYALTVIEKLGLVEKGLVRVGCAFYTTQEEIERLIKAVREITEKNIYEE